MLGNVVCREHNGTEYPTTGHPGGGESRQDSGWGFQWRKSSTRCGLRVPAAGPQHAGKWKCHLANTEEVEVEKIR